VTLNSTASRLGGRSRGTVTRAGHSHACTTDTPSCIADAFIVGTQEKSLARKEDDMARQSPSLIFFDVLALHATHWDTYRRSEEREMRCVAVQTPGMNARASTPVQQRAWCMPMARPELPHIYHVNARHVRPRATSTRYVVEFVVP
jgi:hypothetical protein